MNAISITRTETLEQGTRFHAKAVRGGQEAVGKTRGEALDAIASQLSIDDDAEFFYYAEMKPDPFFTAEQISRLYELRQKQENDTLTEADDLEYKALVEAELLGSARRIAAKLGVAVP